VSAAAPLLAVEGLGKKFVAVQALDGVDLTINSGECVGLVGPNGSGKTTFFNCVTGFLRPSAGRVRIDGEDVTGLAPQKLTARGLVRTFQQVMVFGSETVSRNVEIAIESIGGHRRPDGVSLPTSLHEILQLCKLDAVASSAANNLSYGQARSLGLAIAIAARPRLLMLDEPASGLNDAESRGLSQILRELNQLGLSLLIIDHDMPFLTPIVGRMVVLDAGRKLTEGPPGEVVKDPAVIQAYLGVGLDSIRQIKEGPEQSSGDTLTLSNVSSGYGDIEVLRELSIFVAAGESVAILGSNGAGKTTLLRTVSGILPLRSGRIEFGRLAVGNAASQREMGVIATFARRVNSGRTQRARQMELFNNGIVHVPEGRRIFAGMTVRDNLTVAFQGRDSGFTAVEEALDWVVGIFPVLAEKLKDLGGSLSGGQQQMLAIGRGLMAQPKLLCLDEPSLGLSPLMMEAVAEKIGEIRRSGRLSLLVVEQSASMALALCDRVYLMHTGRIVHHANAAELSLELIREGYFGEQRTPSASDSKLKRKQVIDSQR
jgi:branched-chain amino acid transport system ATP-binding protein